MRFRPHLPREIEEHPDLAALEILRAVADYARAVVIAACPELNLIGDPAENDLGEKVVAVAALLDVLAELDDAIKAVDNDARHERRLIDDELPF